MGPGFAQDNPGIAQIHALRVTYTRRCKCFLYSIVMYRLQRHLKTGLRGDNVSAAKTSILTDYTGKARKTMDDRMTGRQDDRKTGRHEDMKTGRQEDRNRR